MCTRITERSRQHGNKSSSAGTRVPVFHPVVTRSAGGGGGCMTSFQPHGMARPLIVECIPPFLFSYTALFVGGLVSFGHWSDIGHYAWLGLGSLSNVVKRTKKTSYGVELRTHCMSNLFPCRTTCTSYELDHPLVVSCLKKA